MNIQMIARALGIGVECAVKKSFQEFNTMLESRETLSSGDLGLGDAICVYEIISVQKFVHHNYDEIEVKILASDGVAQATAYVYIKSSGIEEAC